MLLCQSNRNHTVAALSTALAVLVSPAACSEPPADGTDTSTSETVGGETGGTVGGDTVGGETAVDETGGMASETEGGDSASESGEPTSPPEMGDPGCGLRAAAFCDPFDAVARSPGRAGDLDPLRWSAARSNPELPTAHGLAIAAGPATIPPCRDDTPSVVFPDQDTLICDPNEGIASHHLLTASGIQNYGQNSYRIRQPFDFADRTGTIVFDAEALVISGLLGWVSVEITEDPTPAPSFSRGEQNNDEGAALPRNALEIQFQATCPGQLHSFGVRMVTELHNYEQTFHDPDPTVCLPGALGKLNHFEILVSAGHLQVYATPYSEDGVTFGPKELLHETDLQLPFSRGYVHITTHNHATIKYSADGANGTTHPYDAWVVRWDNVGFDGPIIGSTRESEVAASMILGEDAWSVEGPVMSVGYRVADEADGPNNTLMIPNVDLTGVVSAQLALTSWVNTASEDVGDYTLRYRLNGNQWRDRPFGADEVAVLTGLGARGGLGILLDVDVADLIDGDNVLEFVSRNIPQNYPPAVASIDLIMTTR